MDTLRKGYNDDDDDDGDNNNNNNNNISGIVTLQACLREDA
jgi:hypothetical protein